MNISSMFNAIKNKLKFKISVITFILIFTVIALNLSVKEPPPLPSKQNTHTVENTSSNKLQFAQIAFKRKKYDIAFKEFKDIGKSSPIALYFLGKSYEEGLGVAQNTKRAIRNYSSAADHGSIDAMKALGTLFSSGVVFGKNYKEAFRWFQQAAMAGDAEAQGRIALMYKNGQGISADLASANAWLDISCAQETVNICSLKENFLLTPEQLKKSHLLAIKYQKLISQSKSSSSYTRIQ